MQTMTTQEKAAEAASWFESATRPDGETRFVRVKGGAPEWVTELVHAAHGDDFLPDDYRYRWTMEACEFIAESDDPDDGSGEFADGAVSVYTSDRIAWLASNLNRAGYCDEAASEFGIEESGGIIDRIGWGMYAEASEVYGLVLDALRV